MCCAVLSCMNSNLLLVLLHPPIHQRMSLIALLSIIPVSIVIAMTSPFRRWRNRLTGTPTTDAAAAPAPKAPTEEELAQDREVFEKAIANAVNSSLINEEFTKAVAGHLALQIQPSIKTALDISTVCISQPNCL